MLRKIWLAGAVALPLGLIGPAPGAFADTDVDIHFGVPFYTYQVSPHYRYYDGYGWYDYYRYPRFHAGYGDDDEGDNYVVRYRHLSCGQAAEIVRDNGYNRVRARNCDGSTYVFRARRDGDTYTIYVNSRNGHMWAA